MAKMRRNELAKNAPPGGRPLVQLDRGAGQPLFRQVYARLRRAILDGELPAGTRLPASRALALQLAVSRPTVQEAYDMLAMEGYVVGRGAKGTMVAPMLARPAAVRRALPAVLRDLPGQ